jgi:hypothetical protein
MNKKATNPIFIIFLVLALVLIGGALTGYSIFGKDYDKDPLPNKISKIPDLNLTEVKNYETYKEFADKTNDLILIINEQAKFNIPLLKTTQEAWGEASKKITKYGPLINNYQGLIQSAKKFEGDRSEENYKGFYLNLGKFSLETSIIGATLFYSASFQGVGILYRASGLNSIALKCPSCVSTILSSAYWTIKTTLVEESSKIAEISIDKLKENIK